MNLEKTRSILAGRIRTLRNSLNLTQEQLAEKANIHATYISRIESGKKLPTLLIICRIADVLGVNVYELFLEDRRIDSCEYKKKKLIALVKESSSSNLDIYSALLNTLHAIYRKKHK